MSGSSTYIFTTNSLNYDIFIRTNLTNPDLQPKIVTLPVDVMEKLARSSRKFGCAIVDPPEALKYPLTTRSAIPKGYIVAAVDPMHMREINCIHDLRCKRIGVTDQTSYKFVKTLQQAYRIRDEDFILEIINPDLLPSLGTVVRSYDIVFTYIIPNSRYFFSIIQQDIAILGLSSSFDIQRARVFWKGLETEDVLIPRVFGTRIATKERYTKLVPVEQYLVAWTAPSPPTNTKAGFEVEPFTINVQLPQGDDDLTGHLFRCTGDPYARSKVECEAPFDTFGRPRTKITAWDGVCTQNEDCPFYDPRKNRGGCYLATGFCELPVGVERIGRRAVNIEPPYQPFCYGCDPFDETCCTRRKNVEWVFPNENRPII